MFGPDVLTFPSAVNVFTILLFIMISLFLVTFDNDSISPAFGVGNNACGR